MKRCVALALAVTAVLTGCTSTASRTPNVTGERTRSNRFTQPHVLRFTTVGDINTLNPHFGQYLPILMLSQLTMAWLIRWDAHNEPFPELATVVPTKANGGISGDGLTITYHLRKGVRWSDGAPFSADDVVFSTRAVLNPANDEVSRTGWDLIDKIDEPDRYTVVYHLRKPYSPFLESFFSTGGANPCILPKHLLASYANLNDVPYNEKPVGIGPFRYVRWDREQRVVLEANPYYWRGLPKLQRIVFEIIPDRNTILTQLQAAHDLDMWYYVSGNYVSRVQSLAQYTLLRQPSYLFNHIDFNLTRPVFQDVVVRRALRLATDRRTLRAKIYHNTGILQDEPAPRTAPYFDPSIPFVEFDPQKANAMLDAAGWKRGPDGVREKNGQRLSFDLASTTGSQDVDKQIELLRAWWKTIGVTFNVRLYPTNLLFAPIEQGGVVYSKDKWDVVILAWQNEAIGDYSPLYSCHGFPPLGQNNLRWCNRGAQAAMDALYGHYDQSQRNRDAAVVMEALNDDVPMIVQSAREDIVVANKDLVNFHPGALAPFDNMMNVDI